MPKINKKFFIIFLLGAFYLAKASSVSAYWDCSSISCVPGRAGDCNATYPSCEFTTGGAPFSTGVCCRWIPDPTPTCTRPYRDECTGCNTRTYYDSCNVAYRVEFSDTSCSSLCPAPPPPTAPDCNTNPNCGTCNSNDLYRCVNNGSQTCTYTTHTSGVSCNQVSYTQTCSTYLCPSDYTCNASTGACQLDLSCTPQSSDTQCGGTCNAATYSSNHTIQVTPSICSDGSIRYSCRDLGAIEGQCGNTTTPPSLCFPP